MASAWGGGVAAALNPAEQQSNFQQQVDEARKGQLTGVFNGNGARMARIMQTAAVKESRLEDPADLRRRHHPRPPHHLPGAAGRSRQLRARPCPAHRRGGRVRSGRRGHRLDLRADGRRRARPALGPRGRRRRRGRPLLGEPVRRGAGARLPGQRPQVQRAHARLHQAFRGLWRGGSRASTTTPSTCRSATLREVYLPPYKAAFDAGALRPWPRSTRSSGIPSTGNHWLHDRPAARRMGFPGLCRLRLHRRRGDDRRTATPRTGAMRPGSPSSPAST